MDTAETTRAVVLFSGGLDSTTVLYVARSEGFTPLALIFDYGQRHGVEVRHALSLARELGVDYRLQRLDLASMGGSALTSGEIEVPKDRPLEEVLGGPVPPTYVPARNTIFLAFALGWMEVSGSQDLFAGVNALDYSGYPDCRPEYVEAFERLANLACRSTVEAGARIRIHTPLLHKTKAEIIRWGVALGVDYSRTWSCYDPRTVERGGPLACGLCDSCTLRKKGFREAGVPDPTEYAVP